MISQSIYKSIDSKLIGNNFDIKSLNVSSWFGENSNIWHFINQHWPRLTEKIKVWLIYNENTYLPY